MIYFISDTHFGHKGSLNWPNGNAREFTNAHEMDIYMIQQWNSVVNPEDAVYHLGDFAYKASPRYIGDIFNLLNGKIILIKGNHERLTLKANNRYNRFDSVHDVSEIEYNGYRFVLFHYPIESWNGKNRGSIHLHGHTHSRNPGISGRIKNVSVECLDYKPISIDEVIQEINAKDKHYNL